MSTPRWDQELRVAYRELTSTPPTPGLTRRLRAIPSQEPVVTHVSGHDGSRAGARRSLLPVAIAAAFAGIALIGVATSGGRGGGDETTVAGAAAVPGAASVDVAPVRFTGRMHLDGDDTAEPEAIAVGIRRTITGPGHGVLNTTDPRLTGRLTMAAVIDEYGEDDDPGRGRLVTATLTVENDAGAWAGHMAGPISEAGVGVSGWLAGAGAYEGLHAFIATDGWTEVWGYVTPVRPTDPPSIDAAALAPSPELATGERIIDLEADGTLRFIRDGEPIRTLAVRPGERITFRIANTAGFEHSFWIGDAGSDSALREPEGTTGVGIPAWAEGVRELEWVVPRDPGQLNFACTVPGHYELMNVGFTLVAG